jgi:hypothetical protein
MDPMGQRKPETPVTPIQQQRGEKFGARDEKGRAGAVDNEEQEKGYARRIACSQLPIINRGLPQRETRKTSGKSKTAAKEYRTIRNHSPALPISADYGFTRERLSTQPLGMPMQMIGHEA